MKNFTDIDFDAKSSQICLFLVLFGFAAIVPSVLLLLSARNKNFLGLLGPGIQAGLALAVVLV